MQLVVLPDCPVVAPGPNVRAAVCSPSTPSSAPGKTTWRRSGGPAGREPVQDPRPHRLTTNGAGTAAAAAPAHPASPAAPATGRARSTAAPAVRSHTRCPAPRSGRRATDGPAWHRRRLPGAGPRNGRRPSPGSCRCRFFTVGLIASRTIGVCGSRCLQPRIAVSSSCGVRFSVTPRSAIVDTASVTGRMWCRCTAARRSACRAPSSSARRRPQRSGPSARSG